MREFLWTKSAILLSLILLISSTSVLGQYGTKFEVIPPSPGASSLGKFGEVPVSLFTGIPQITVPIHRYAGISNKLSLNISLDYHAGGVKVAEVASNVGLNWALNAGGVISRTIYGLADFSPAGFNISDTLPNGTGQLKRIKGCLEWVNVGGYANNANNDPCNGQPGCLDNVSDFYKIVDIYKGNRDGQFDVFNYSFGGYSGKFIIGKNDSILQMPQTNLKISRISGINIQGFTITTPEGTQYVFNEWEYNNYVARKCPYAPPIPLDCPSAGFNQDISSWYLTRIYSPSKADSITFTYEGAVLRYESNMGESYYLGSTGTPVYEKITAYHGDVGGFVPNEKRVTNIQFPDNTSINFQYDNSITRNDLKINGSPRALKKIILNGSNFSYEYQLFHSYFSSSGSRLAYNAPHPSDDYNHRLVLDSIKRINGSTIEPFYMFTYENGLPGRFSNAQDHWGFYNAASGNISLIPASANMTADRTTNANVSKSGTLTKVTYPTGGSTSFEFTSNHSAIGDVGGIRILKTVDYDGISHLNDITTEYSYSEGTATQPVYNYTLFLRIPNNLDQIYNVYSSFSNLTLGQYRGSSATYQTVTVSKTKGTQKLGKTVYSFSNEGRLLYNGGFDPDYSKGYPYVPIQYLDWADGLLTNEKHFDDQNNPIKEVIYDYDISKIKVKNAYFKAIKVAPLAGPYECGSSYCNSDCSLSIYPNGSGGNSQEKDYVIYTTVNYYPYTGKSQLLKKTEKDFDINGNISVKEINYTYNSTYQLITQQTVNNSKGEELKTTFKYPFDFLSTPVYQKMVNKNIVSAVIEQKSFNTSNQLNFVKKNYFEPYPNLYVTQSIEEQIRNNPMEIVMEFTNFDMRGNLLESHAKDDIKKSYQWMHNASYPEVEIKNAENTLATTTTVGTVNGSLNMPGSAASASFTTITSGNIVLSIMGDPGNTYGISYTLTTPGTSRTGNLCAVRAAGGSCSFPETVTLTSMPAGEYTLSISLNSGSGVYKGITYSYQGNQSVITGIKEFFFEGFEENSSAITGSSHSGRKYWNSGYTTSFTPPNGRAYVIQWWNLSGGKWIFNEQAFTTNVILTGPVDDVRILPKDALMTSYTYDPLIGMTSQTDPSGRTVTYEYDSFGRLKTIRDQDKNVIKTLDYQYQKPNNQ